MPRPHPKTSLPDRPEKQWWTRAELRRELGLSTRTLGRYMMSGLHEPPIMKGRAPLYSAETRLRLLATKQLRRKGYSPTSLVTIFRTASQAQLREWAGLPALTTPAELTAPTSSTAKWTRHAIGKGLELHVPDTAALTTDQLARVLAAISNALAT